MGVGAGNSETSAIRLWRLVRSGTLTRQWFKEHLPECDAEGDCNFTTVGGLVTLLGVAIYMKQGIYQRKS